jgi:hypothetical protein
MAEDVWDLSDEDLEAAFKEAKAQDESPETAIEDEGEVDELEQPEEDSDDDTSTDDELEEVEDEDPEEEEGEPDEELDADEDKSEDEDDEAKAEEVQPTQDQLEEFFAQKSNVRANGMDHEFTNKEKLEMFDKMFPQATDYTKKMQAIKPYRKTIDAIEQAGLGQEDVNLMIDVLKGDKDAIADVLKRTGVDALDLDTENTNYVAKDYGRNDTELAIKDIVDEISIDKEYATTHNVLEKQWDDRSRDAFIEDPSMIKLLHIDVKSGMYDTINPIAQKLKVYDGGAKSDLDYYKAASQQYFESQAQNGSKARDAEAAEMAREAKETEARKVEEVKARRAKQSATKKASAKRKAAAPTKKSAGTKQVNYLDDSDEAFEDWYNKLQDSL